MDAGGGGGGQRTMAQLHKFRAALVTGARVSKNLLRFQIQKTQPHRAKSQDAFQMPASSTAAVVLVFIERHHGVPAFPNAVNGGRAPEADAVAEGPHADRGVSPPLRGGAT